MNWFSLPFVMKPFPFSGRVGTYFKAIGEKYNISLIRLLKLFLKAL